MLYALFAPEWLKNEDPSIPNSLQLDTDFDAIVDYNKRGMNVYYYPNYCSVVAEPNVFLKAHDIDVFDWVFVDYDLKSNVYPDKESFIEQLGNFSLTPTMIVDSGNGVHAYWKVTDLDVGSYLRIQRRLMRLLKTDEAVCQIKQLMRVPGTHNTKVKGQFKLCETIYRDDTNVYTSEELDKALPKITVEDEQYCVRHLERATGKSSSDIKVDYKLPLKFSKLIDSSKEVREIWLGNTGDRSVADYRLAHIMFAAGFTREEAASVLVNTAKAASRAPTHQISYATNIIDKIWTFEITEDKSSLTLSKTIRETLAKSGDNKALGKRFPCWKYFDNTHKGFRLGQVIGLVAGSGVGKTAIALNMIEGFIENNPDYDHFVVPLEQPADEIAERWVAMCKDKPVMLDKLHIISNYDDEGNFRHLSLDEIREYLIKFQKVTGKKVGSVTIDHIGALKKNNKLGENQGVVDICHAMKSFAVQTGCLLIMQSQTNREKAGIGDIELNKDAAYGTMFFEAYCDYLITVWQPLKRCYGDGAPTVTAFKFCKIRHKKQNMDTIIEDRCYRLMFDPETERLRKMNSIEDESFKFWNTQATNKRKQDRKTDIIEYVSAPFEEGNVNGKTNNNQDFERNGAA